MKNKKAPLLIVAGLVTILIVYSSVRFLLNDTVVSIIPGWHTTMYPPAIVWTAVTMVILVTSLVIYLIFNGMAKLLAFMWVLLKSMTKK